MKREVIDDKEKAESLPEKQEANVIGKLVEVEKTPRSTQINFQLRSKLTGVAGVIRFESIIKH